MKDHTPNVSTPDGDGHVHRGLGQFGGGIGVAESEPEDPPGEQVLDRSQVDGTLLGVDLFEIAAPLLIRPRSCEIAADQIRRNRSALVRGGSALAGAVSAVPTSPWVRIDRATVFSETRSPSPRSWAQTRGEP